MKYIILKPSDLLCVELGNRFDTSVRIACFGNESELERHRREQGVDLLPLDVFRFISRRVEFKEAIWADPVEDGIFIRKMERFNKIIFADITWIEASRSYCYIHQQEQAPVIVTYPLSEVKKKLPANIFMQIHRSYVVNLRHVDGFIGNMLCINNNKLPISKSYRKAVFSRFVFMGSADQGECRPDPTTHTSPCVDEL